MFGICWLVLEVNLIQQRSKFKMKRNKKSYEEIDSELYSTHILEQIMQSHEWNDLEDISKLTFKAVTDILQTHAQSLKDLKAIITTRASKTQLNTGLSLKCNVSDVTKTVEQLSQALQEKVAFKDVNQMLKEFPSKADIIEILAEQSPQQHQSKIGERNSSVELQILKARMDDFQKQISKRVGLCVNLTEFQEVLNILQNKANISQVNEALENKINKQYLTTALQKKISKNELETMLTKKADTADLDYLINSLESKVSVNTLQKLTQVLENKADKSDLVLLGNERNNNNRSQHRLFQEEWYERVEQIKNSLSSEIKEFKRESSLQYKELQSQFHASKKNDELQYRKLSSNFDIELQKKILKVKNEISEQLQGIRLLNKNLQNQMNNREKIIGDFNSNLNLRKKNQEKLYDEIDNVHKKLEEHINKSLDKNQFFDFKSCVLETMESKAEVEEIQTAFDKFAGEINLKIAENIEQMEQVMRLHHNYNEMNTVNSSQIAEIRKTICKKQDRNDNLSFEQNFKKIRRQIQECRKTVDIAYGQIHSKISVRQYETDLLELHKRMEAMKKEISIKANIKDVCVLSDSKPNIQDVNNTLREINEILADKVSQVDFQNMIKNQEVSLQALSEENIVGRWMWQSGQLKPGGLIPWQSEIANTLKEGFFWQKDKTSILIISAGIFEVTVCIFNKNSWITILANGQKINSKQNQESTNANVRRNKKKREKEIASTSVCQYLMLPARSRISVLCSESSEGFINIRRI